MQVDYTNKFADTLAGAKASLEALLAKTREARLGKRQQQLAIEREIANLDDRIADLETAIRSANAGLDAAKVTL